MPAATLWKGNCKYLPQRYFYNDSTPHPGEYDIYDMADRLSRITLGVEAVTLRPGYRITLYSKNGWIGEEETITGAYEEGGEKEEKL